MKSGEGGCCRCALVESDRAMCVCGFGTRVVIENGEMVVRPAEYGQVAVRRRAGCRAPPARNIVVVFETIMVSKWDAVKLPTGRGRWVCRMIRVVSNPLMENGARYKRL